MDTIAPKQKKASPLFFIPFVVFVILIAMTIIAWNFTYMTVQKKEQQTFDNDTAVLNSAIVSRFSVYETVLYDVKALFAASNSVQRNEFISYLQTSNVTGRFPGISGISFANHVLAIDKDTFVQSVIQDTSLVPTGYPFFAVKPSGNRSDYYISTYTLSATSSAIASASAGFGLDLLSIPERADAIKKAVDSNLPVASDITTLLGNQPNRLGFVMYLPVYKNRLPIDTITQRRNNVLGVISATFNANNLFSTILTEEKIPSLAMAVYDAQDATALTSDDLLYNSNPQLKQSHIFGLSKTVEFSLGQRNWIIIFTTLPGYGLALSEQVLPWIVLSGGALVSFLLSFALYLLITSRARALSLATNMTQKLAQSEEQYRTIFETLQDVYYRTDKEGTILAVSPSIEHYIGIKPEQIIGQNANVFYFDPQEREKLMQALQQSGSVTDYSLTLKGKDQQPMSVSLTGHLLFDDNKQATGLEGILRDVTERSNYEKELQERTEELQRSNKTMVDRELKMVELKKELADLKQQP